MESKQKLKGIILIIISAIGYGIMPAISVFSYAKGVSVEQLLFYRFAISALVLWSLIGIFRIPYKTTLKHGLYLMILGFLGYALCAKALFIGYQYVSGSIATMILFSHPLMVVAGEALLQKRVPGRQKIISMVLALIGLLVIVFEKEVHYSKWGILLCFLSALSYAVYCLGLSEPQTKKMHTLSVAAYVVTVSAVFNLGECLVGGQSLVITDGPSLVLLVTLALAGTVIPVLAFFSGLKIVGSGSATIISTVEPAFVYLIEIFLLNGSFIIKNIFGSVLIILAILLIRED